MNYGYYFIKKQCKKKDYKTKRKYTNRDPLEFFLEGPYFFINRIFLIYIPATLWDFSWIIF